MKEYPKKVRKIFMYWKIIKKNQNIFQFKKNCIIKIRKKIFKGTKNHLKKKLETGINYKTLKIIVLNEPGMNFISENLLQIFNKRFSHVKCGTK